MTDCSRRKACVAMLAWFVLMVFGMATALYAQTPDDTAPDDTALDASAVIEAVIRHPSVELVRTRICSAASQYDIARSQQLPQVNASLRKNDSLLSDIKTTEVEGRNLEFEAVDGVVSLNQLLWDWGLSEADKKIALNERTHNMIALRLEIDRIAADMLDLSLRLSEHRERLTLYEDYIAALQPLTERLEASVSAGVSRIGDLRAIKIVELDAEIQRSIAERQIALTESELAQRFGVTFAQVEPLLARFYANRPEDASIIDSATSREIRRLDIQIQSSSLEVEKLIAERYPQVMAGLDFTFFDVDDYDNEYELTGNIRLNMPLYDGGSNQARRNQAQWQKRGLENERANILRQHGNALATTVQNIERARENLIANADKKTEVEQRLAEAEARQGATVSDTLAVAQTREQLTTVLSEQIALRHQIEIALLQGLFFVDKVGETLTLPYGGSQC